MTIVRPGPSAGDAWEPLTLADVEEPRPGAGEVRVRIRACGVCRTDLDLAEGRLRAARYPLIPGHQIVGHVDALGPGLADSPVREGDRVGIAWIHSACGACRWCRRGDENLCPDFRATGCDVPGGFAEWATAPAAFVHPLPDGVTNAAAAPLLCAGAIGWRSLRLAAITDGEPLGLTGFGASAHLVLQLARRQYPSSSVFVFARSPEEQAFARELGAVWAGDTMAVPPEPLRAIIDTTPAWTPIVEGLRCLEPGGRLVVNAIRKESRDQEALLRLDYATHLWMERQLVSVANVTRRDVREMLAVAADGGVAAAVEEMPLERANDALRAIRRGGLRGARVLRID